jgi:protein gp37
MAKRLKAMGLEQYQHIVDEDGWTGRVSRAQHLMDQPTRWKKPRAIFVCSMGDLFYGQMPHAWINEVWMQIFNNPRHLFLILTKRPELLLAWTQGKARATTWPIDEIWPENALLGVTAENQEMANERVPLLLSVPCRTRFVSCEPLLTPVDLTDLPANAEFIGDGQNYNDYLCALTGRGYEAQAREYTPTQDFRKLSWVIVGGESGNHCRLMRSIWARKLLLQCRDANVPFFMKQMSGRTPAERQNIPHELRVREWPTLPK